MRSRDIVGKRIVAIEQRRVFIQRLGRHEFVSDAILLEDGTRVSLVPIADHNRRYVQAVVTRRRLRDRIDDEAG